MRAALICTANAPDLHDSSCSALACTAEAVLLLSRLECG